MDPLLMEIISWLVILMHHTCLDLLSILRLSYAHNKKSDSSWSRIAERRAWACFAEFGNRLPWHDVPAGP